MLIQNDLLNKQSSRKKRAISILSSDFKAQTVLSPANAGRNMMPSETNSNIKSIQSKKYKKSMASPLAALNMQFKQRKINRRVEMCLDMLEQDGTDLFEDNKGKRDNLESCKSPIAQQARRSMRAQVSHLGAKDRANLEKMISPANNHQAPYQKKLSNKDSMHESQSSYLSKYIERNQSINVLRITSQPIGSVESASCESLEDEQGVIETQTNLLARTDLGDESPTQSYIETQSLTAKQSEYMSKTTKMGLNFSFAAIKSSSVTKSSPVLKQPTEYEQWMYFWKLTNNARLQQKKAVSKDQQNKHHLLNARAKQSSQLSQSHQMVLNQYQGDLNRYFGNHNEHLYRKMADVMVNQLKRAELGSEYGASNLTQITDYRLGRHLGAGAYASVKRATHKLTGMVLAIKIYEKFKLMENHRKKNVIKEIHSLKKIQGHDNVVRLYDVIDTPKQLYLVLEFVKGTMLSSYLKDYNKTENQQPTGKINQSDIMSSIGMMMSSNCLPEQKAMPIMKQVLQSLEFVHSKQMAHRDLKAENIMYDKQTGRIQLIDFGFACSAKEKLKVFCGTPSYMSPEIVGKREYIGSAVDIWAAGVLLYSMLCGIMPFKAANERDLYRKIQRGVFQYPAKVASSLSPEVKDLLKRLLNVDQNKRISAIDALQHKWLIN